MRTMSRRARPHTITVFNYVGTTAGVASYQKTVIEHVYLDKAYRQRLNQRGIQTEDDGFCLIDLSDMDTTGARTYIAPEQWAGLTTQQKASYFTFDVATDFLVEGTPAETLPAATRATMQGLYRCYGISSAAAPASSQATQATLEVVLR